MSRARAALAGLSFLVLVGLAGWSVGPGEVEGPARVEAPQAFQVVHAGDGRVRWTLLDGAVPGGPGVAADGVVQGERGVPVEVVRAPGIAEGSRVEAGDVIATVRTSGLGEEVDALQAEADALAADIALLDAGGRPESVRRAGEAVHVAEANLEQARANLAQLEGLVAQGAAGSWEVVEARNVVAVRTAERDLARAQQDEARLPVRAEERAVLEARLAAARARATAAAARADGHAVRSPIAGRVTVPGGDVVLSVVADGPAYVHVAISEAEASELSPGDTLTFAPTAGGAPAVAARVERIAPSAVPMGGRTVVWAVAATAADAASTGAALDPGATGRATIATGGWR